MYAITCRIRLQLGGIIYFAHQGNDIAEHVEAVSHEGHAVGDVADDQLDEHEKGGHGEHPEQSWF